MPLERSSFHSLEVRDLSYHLRLGCTQEERERPQEVSLSVTFRFPSAPVGMISDELRDTICFARLSDALERHFSGREYKLIERIGGEVYLIARELARGTADVAVRVHKLKPPVANLLGGAVFTCGDFAP